MTWNFGGIAGEEEKERQGRARELINHSLVVLVDLQPHKHVFQMATKASFPEKKKKINILATQKHKFNIYLKNEKQKNNK